MNLPLIQALATPIIALAVAGIAFGQWRIASIKLQHELFERRFKIYQTIAEFLGGIAVTGRVVQDDFAPLYVVIREAKFLFPRPFDQFMEELYERATFLQLVMRRIEHPFNQNALERHLDQEGKHKAWLLKQLLTLADRFDPYLHIGPRHVGMAHLYRHPVFLLALIAVLGSLMIFGAAGGFTADWWMAGELVPPTKIHVIINRPAP